MGVALYGWDVMAQQDSTSDLSMGGRRLMGSSRKRVKIINCSREERVFVHVSSSRNRNEGRFIHVA